MPRIADDLIPTSDAAIDSASTAARWRTVFARELRALGTPAGTEGQVNLYAQSDTARALASFFRARDNAGALEALATGDSLGELGWYGYDGSAYQQGAFIRSPTDGTIAAGRMPSRIEFGTAPDSVSAPTTRWRMMPSGILQPGADSTYDIGTPAVRVNHVYSDQEVAATPADVSVASTTDVTVATKQVENLAAGDVVKIETWLTILNNSGAGRIYVVTLDIGTTFDLEWTMPSLPAGTTTPIPIRMSAVLDVRSTSLAYFLVEAEVGNLGAAGTDLTISSSLPKLGSIAWNTVASNLTGTQTVNLFVRNTTAATATQTARVHLFRVERVRA